MAKESITVRCYPSQERINEEIKLYESFGWELTNNQNCQEYTGYFDESFYSESYNILTFSREKDKEWYSDVAELEAKYKSVKEELDVLNNSKPKQPQVFDNNFLSILLFCLGGIFAFAGGLMLLLSLIDAIEFYWSFIPLGIGASLLLGALAFKRSEKKLISAYNKELEIWHGLNDSRVERLKEQINEIARQAYKITNA